MKLNYVLKISKIDKKIIVFFFLLMMHIVKVTVYKKLITMPLIEFFDLCVVMYLTCHTHANKRTKTFWPCSLQCM